MLKVLYTSRLKHHHRKKTINHMEDVILCSQCVRTLKNIEKQEKEIVRYYNMNNDDLTCNFFLPIILFFITEGKSES